MTDEFDLGYTKAGFITDIIVIILNSLVFIFLTFILYKVNNTEINTHRCTITLMIICLLLAVTCKFFFPIVYIYIYLL